MNKIISVLSIIIMLLSGCATLKEPVITRVPINPEYKEACIALGGVVIYSENKPNKIGCLLWGNENLESFKAKTPQK